MKMIKTVAIILGLTWGIFVSKDSLAVVVKQMNLEEIINTAQYIFSGHCTGVESRYDDETGRDVIFCTFKISNMIKGEQSDRFTFKMSKVVVDIGDAPTFKTGDDVVLFLYGRSTLGFTSPVGLGQGKFSVRYSSIGEKVVVNENNNLNLFKGIDRAKYLKRFTESKYEIEIDRVMTNQSGSINYQTFLRLVEGMVH